MRILIFLSLWLPQQAWADPFDNGEAYANRPGPPPWMDGIDVGLLIVNYGIFALALIALGWLLLKRPEMMLRLESTILFPFKSIFAAAKRANGMTEILLQTLGGLAAFIALASWVFFCQWLKHEGLGAISMFGLAFAALMLVRLLKGDDKTQSVS